MTDKSCVHEKQRIHAQIAMLCCGKMPMRADPHLFGHMFEDYNVYHIEISDEFPGPSVRMSVGGLPLDYWPCLTAERAQRRARAIAFGDSHDD